MANLSKKMLFQQLTDFLLTKLPQRYHQHFYSWIENGELINQGKNITPIGIEIAYIQYDAVLWFEEFPYREINSQVLMAQIQLWLDSNDELRDLVDDYKIKFDLDILDDNTANLQFNVSFLEPLTAVIDPAGELEIDGQRYRLDNIEIYYAEEVEMQCEVEK